MGQAINADHTMTFLFPPAIEDWIPALHPARFIREFVSGLDLAELGFTVKVVDKAGADHYGAELLLSVWLYGYFERVRSSRKLEKALVSDIGFIWLAGMHRPDHSSLWRFWSKNKAALRKVFKETVLVADDMGMIGFVLMAVDGTKLQASGSRRAMWSERSLAAKEKALDEAIGELEAAIGNDTTPDADPSIPAALARKSALREEIRVKRAHLKARGRKHEHPGEPDARVMVNQRTRDLCYNVQAVADSASQIVTACAVVTDEVDLAQLVPMIDQVVGNLGRAAEDTLADMGYTSEVQVALAAEKGYPVLTTGAPKRGGSDERFNSERFIYDPATKTLTCPNNDTLLKFERDRKRRGKLELAVYRCKNNECPLRDLCSKDKRGKSVEVSQHRPVMQDQAAKRAAPGGREKIKERAGIIEPIFAYTKEHGRFKRFSFRGLEGVNTQWAVEMASHNLRKVFKMWASSAAPLGPGMASLKTGRKTRFAQRAANLAA